MKKQITFEGNYTQDGVAIEWLLNLSRCFSIKKVRIKSYIKKRGYATRHCCKVIVEFE